MITLKNKCEQYSQCDFNNMDVDVASCPNKLGHMKTD